MRKIDVRFSKLQALNWNYANTFYKLYNLLYCVCVCVSESICNYIKFGTYHICNATLATPCLNTVK